MRRENPLPALASGLVVRAPHTSAPPSPPLHGHHGAGSTKRVFPGRVGPGSEPHSPDNEGVCLCWLESSFLNPREVSPSALLTNQLFFFQLVILFNVAKHGNF